MPQTHRDKYFIPFQADVSQFELPQKFTFPFSYEPLPITMQAVEEVQEMLKVSKTEGTGKMIGVLVVKNQDNELGYLIAFSGQLGGERYPFNFVPPIFDRLEEGGFFKKGEEELIAINQQIEAMENSEVHLAALKDLEEQTRQAEEEIAQGLQEKQAAKKRRWEIREEAKTTHSEEAYKELDKKLRGESTNIDYNFKRLKAAWRKKLATLKERVEANRVEVEKLKAKRKAKSVALHQKIFDQYQFLNQYKETKGLPEIFEEFPQPPAGAGDCAAPKLLQYAFQHGFIPITLAEFWWGRAVKSEIRQQGKFYPACHSRCRPILQHMLKDIPLDPDPLKSYSAEDKIIEKVYEDEYLLVINKPAGLLSVPSKEIQDSVLTRIQKEYPEADGPLMVHRIDQLTSGILVIAKSMDIYKKIQRQFIQRTVQKQYVAVLEGLLEEDSGKIDLPIAPDFERKPMQKVCEETGKYAITEWQVLSKENGRTRVQFKPITGRTHQLRVHAAHHKGLNMPIVGDLLYGQKDERLLLHAEKLEFIHPKGSKPMKFEVKAEF